MTRFPCPKCGKPSGGIAEDYDPFDLGRGMQAVTVAMKCPEGHEWFETEDRHAGRVRSGIVGEPGWADNSPWPAERKP